jgi:predicted dehydrogenase
MGEGLPGRLDAGALRVGVIGAGFIGEVHARAARGNGARLVAVAASTSESTRDAVVRLGAERAGRSAEEVATADDVDVVHICTPNALHRSLAEAALDAGKHVVCEKPLAVDAAGAASLVAAAASGGSIATVPFVYRFYPMVREARARLTAEGTTLRLVHGGYLQDWMSTEDDDNWRVDPATSGPSRTFADIGSHWCDLVEFVTGDRIRSVSAELITAIPERVARGPHAHAFSKGDGSGDRRPVETEDAAVVTFRTVGGVAGTVLVSQISSGHKNQLRFEVTTADETVAFDQEHPDQLWVGRRVGTELVARDADALHPSASRYVVVPPGHPQGYQECFDAFVADTYRAVAAGSADAIDGLPTFADGARAAEITAAVLRSASERTWIDVDNTNLPVPTSQEVSG